jgi:VanZ like family/Concanavalin A-like lectin/glucanases superfamily
MVLRLLCALILAAILIAGLWPFHAPKNSVHWAVNANGLRIGKYGSIVTANEFTSPSAAPNQDLFSTIEIWLEPRRARASGTILAFYHPATQTTSFALRQSLGDLVMLTGNPDASRPAKKSHIFIDNILHQTPVLIAIVSGSSGTTVYVDGVLVKKQSSFQFSATDLTGKLILGNSAVATDEWAGWLKGLAITRRALTAEEVVQHHQRWIQNDKPENISDADTVALYTFDEKTGNIAHNQSNASTGLIIPAHFFLLQEKFLDRPWNEFHNNWGYWKDVIVNIVGFIPFGLFFTAYFSSLRKFDYPAALTIALGFAISLTIEVLQGFMPTRDSSMTDLINNTLGTAIGAGLVNLHIVQSIFAMTGVLPRNTRITVAATKPEYETVSS